MASNLAVSWVHKHFPDRTFFRHGNWHIAHGPNLSKLQERLGERPASSIPDGRINFCSEKPDPPTQYQPMAVSAKTRIDVLTGSADELIRKFTSTFAGVRYADYLKTFPITDRAHLALIHDSVEALIHHADKREELRKYLAKMQECVNYAFSEKRNIGTENRIMSAAAFYYHLPSVLKLLSPFLETQLLSWLKDIFSSPTENELHLAAMVDIAFAHSMLYAYSAPHSEQAFVPLEVDTDIASEKYRGVWATHNQPWWDISFRCESGCGMDWPNNGLSMLASRKYAELLFSLMRSAGMPKILAALGMVDYLCALAALAERLHFVRPQYSSYPEVSFKNARHPYYYFEHGNPNPTYSPIIDNPADIVPVSLGIDQNDKILILTGPNEAGKSTVLRIIGALAYMNQIGSFVPAESARLGIFGRIGSSFHVTDDISRGKSSGRAEMEGLADELKAHLRTYGSLLLVDEGLITTDPDGGAPIVGKVCVRLAGQETGIAIFATHYRNQAWALQEENIPGMRFAQMEAAQGQDNSLIFTRKIIPGITEIDYAEHLARVSGLRAVLDDH